MLAPGINLGLGGCTTVMSHAAAVPMDRDETSRISAGQVSGPLPFTSSGESRIMKFKFN